VAGALKCEHKVKNITAMNDVFRCLGFEMGLEPNAAVLSIFPHRVDFKLLRNMCWALYALMETGFFVVPTADSGVIPHGGCSVAAMPSPWKRLRLTGQLTLPVPRSGHGVLDCEMPGATSEAAVNRALAQLYASPEGWDLRVMCRLDERCPLKMVATDQATGVAQISRLTGMSLNAIAKDVARQGMGIRYVRPVPCERGKLEVASCTSLMRPCCISRGRRPRPSPSCARWRSPRRTASPTPRSACASRSPWRAISSSRTSPCRPGSSGRWAIMKGQTRGEGSTE
jgi:hypothetical protein